MRHTKIAATAALLTSLVLASPVTGYAAENRWGIELEQEEKDNVARILWHEAGNQSTDEQYKVVAVIFNRLVSDRFNGDTVYEILTAPGQFVGSGHLSTMPVNDEQLNVVDEVLDGASADVTDNFNCYFFYGDGYRNHFY